MGRIKINKLAAIFLAIVVSCTFCMFFPHTKVYAAQNRTAYFNKSYTLGDNLSQNMINVAYAQIGKTGSDLKYTENWCADFVSDCAELAGFGDSVPRNAICDDLYDGIKKAGGIDINKSQAQPGDIVFYDSNANDSANHVEIVYSGTGESLLSIGGNTGSDYISSAKVCSPRNHPYDILWIVRPAGGTVLPNDDELGIPYPRPQVSSTVWLGKNGITSGNYVKWLQTALNKADNAGLDVDGEFGSATTTAVKNFQGKYGLTQDGQAGTATINKLVEAIKGQNHVIPAIHCWISDNKMGNSAASVEINKWYYLCYELTDQNTSQLLNSATDKYKNYSVTEEIYDPNGNLFHSYTYENSDNNWIGFKFDYAGTYKYKVIISGDLSWSGEKDFSVSDGKPNLEAPALKVDVNGQEVTFSWNLVDNATGYDLRIYYADGTSFADYWDCSNTANSLALTMPANSKFYASVCSKNSNYEECWKYCEYVHFTTGVSSSIVDVGTDFYAIIDNVRTKYLLTNSNGNAKFCSPTEENNQYWYFSRNSNGSYTIESFDRNQALDVSGGSTADGTNIGLYEKNGTLAQQWYIYWAPNGGMYFKSALGNYALDMNGGVDNGANANLWHFCESTAQVFEFYRIDLDNNMPDDLGEYFFAKIINTATGKALSNISNANLAGEDSEFKEEQTWCFIRKNNGSYKIMSYFDVNQSLDVVDFGTENATNVSVCIDSDNIAQRFFLYEIDGDIYIKAMCSNNVFNMDLNTLNVSTWNYVKGVDPERFSIKKLDEDKYVKLEIIQKPTKLTYNVGDKLDTSGLVIKQIYETGRSFTTSSGFTVDKNILKLGDNKVTVTYEGKTATFNITVTGLTADLNQDGSVTILDALLLQKHLLNFKRLTTEQMKLADINSDGRVNILDMCLLKEKLK